MTNFQIRGISLGWVPIIRLRKPKSGQCTPRCWWSDILLRMRLPKMEVFGVIIWTVLQVSWSFDISGRLSADSLALMRSKRSVTCNKGTVDNFIKSVATTCPSIKSVDAYIANINSREAVPVPSSNDNHGFKSIVTHYNNDLKRAKDHCNPWRNGDSIFSSINEMVNVAKQFEPKFNREFEQNKARVKNIIEKHEDIGAVEAKIAALREEIREAQAAIATASDATVKTHLGKIINSKEGEIRSTTQNHEVLQAKRELEELIKYLEFVRGDAAQIKAKAEKARSKISQFRDNTANDAGAFKRHRNTAKESMTKLRQEKDKNNREMANIQREINNLNNKIAGERNQITSLNNQIARARTELQNTERDIARSEKKARKKKKIGRILTYFVPFVGPALSKSAKRRLNNLANQKRALINEHTRQVQTLQSQIAANNRDIAQFQSSISTHNARSAQLDKELQHFNAIDGKLGVVESETTSILPKITSAIVGMDTIRNTFDAIRAHLDDTIKKAKASKTEAEVRNIKHFIYNEIDQLKCKWNEAHRKIIPVGQCK